MREFQRAKFGYAALSTEAITCEHCDQKFLPKKNAQKYCSIRCARLGRYERNPEKYRTKAIRARQRNVEKYRERDRIAYKANPKKVSDRRYAARLQSPWRGLVHAAKSRAKTSGLPFNLTEDWCKSRWTGRCELTGLEFTPPKRTGKGGGGVRSPSIDKIIPNLGYTQSNCRLILHCLNLFKLDGSDDSMYEVAEALIKHRQNICRMG